MILSTRVLYSPWQMGTNVAGFYMEFWPFFLIIIVPEWKEPRLGIDLLGTLELCSLSVRFEVVQSLIL